MVLWLGFVCLRVASKSRLIKMFVCRVAKTILRKHYIQSLNFSNFLTHKHIHARTPTHIISYFWISLSLSLLLSHTRTIHTNQRTHIHSQSHTHSHEIDFFFINLENDLINSIYTRIRSKSSSAMDFCESMNNVTSMKIGPLSSNFTCFDVI